MEISTDSPDGLILWQGVVSPAPHWVPLCPQCPALAHPSILELTHITISSAQRPHIAHTVMTYRLFLIVGHVEAELTTLNKCMLLL